MESSDSAGVTSFAPEGGGSAAGDGRTVRMEESDGAEDSVFKEWDRITVVLYSECVLDVLSIKGRALSPR